MLKAIRRLGSQIWQRRLMVLASLLAFGIVAVVAVYSWNSWNEPTREECIAELKRAGADVGCGASSEEYNVSFFDSKTLDDHQLKAIIPYLHGLEPLSYLNLRRTQLSDDSVDLLAQCRVGALHITETKISAKGAAELRRKLPSTWISHGSIKY